MWFDHWLWKLQDEKQDALGYSVMRNDRKHFLIDRLLFLENRIQNSVFYLLYLIFGQLTVKNVTVVVEGVWTTLLLKWNKNISVKIDKRVLNQPMIFS